MKRIRIAWLIGAALLWGCQVTPNEKKSLVFAYGEGGELKQKLLHELTEGFVRENPGVSVFSHPMAPTTDNQRVFYLTTLGAKSTFVDVFELDVIWTAEFAAAGLLLDLTGRKGFEEPDRFVPPLVKQATYDHRLYAAPYTINYGALFYRRDLLKKHNLSPPKNLEQLVEQARLVSQAEGIYGFLWQAADYEGLACNFIEFYLSHGGTIDVSKERVVFDLEKTRQTLQFMADTIHRHRITPEAILGHHEGISADVFGEGSAVFMRNWHNAAPYIQLEEKLVGMLALPSAPGPLSGGWLLAVNTYSDNPEQATRFLEFMVRAESQRLIASRSGRGPSLLAMYPDSPDLPRLPPGAPDRAVIRPHSPYYSELSLVLTQETRKVLQQHSSAKDAAARIVARSQKLELPELAVPGFPETNFMTRYRP